MKSIRATEKINQLDLAIENSIEKLKNATTGIETKAAILEYERLMIVRETAFLKLIINAVKEKE